jgi:hypothetical protein
MEYNYSLFKGLNSTNVRKYEKWVISDFQNFYRIFLIGQVKLLYGNFCPINIVLNYTFFMFSDIVRI